MDVATDPTAVELASRLGMGVTRLQRQLRQQSADVLTLTQLSTLSTIERRGPLTLGALAACEKVAPPTITRVVAKLEAHGHVKKVVDVSDRRVTRVEATTAGSRHLAAVRRRRNAWLATRLAALDADERSRLAAALEVIERLSEDGGDPAP